MTALSAARMQAQDARTQVARRLDAAATQLQRQAAHVRAGGTYEPALASIELDGISEWVDILDAHEYTVRLLREAAQIA
jgi:hypothetical protein